MLGAGMRLGEDRFYTPSKGRRSRDQLRRAQSDVTGNTQSVHSPASEKIVNEDDVSPLCNLKRFLGSVTPSVPAQYLSKTTMRGWRTCDVEYQPYFVLGDLWESFKEWSVYGVGVPLVLDDSDSVVQYYVPFLSAIQIYRDPSKSSMKSSRPGEESDGDFRDSSSDGSSDSEHESFPLYFKGLSNNYHSENGVSLGYGRPSMVDSNTSFQEGFSSDEGESASPRRYLLFEYFEKNQPHIRQPLADKLLDLALQFPELKSLRSCDLLSCSWISVAWYPIYRIPTGPTVKDLDASFLTFHNLHTPTSGIQSGQNPVLSCPNEMDGVPVLSLPVVGLASYKFKPTRWTPNQGSDQPVLNSLIQGAENLISRLKVNHPDFLFFSRR